MIGWPLGYGKRILAEVDSTNAEAARIAPTLGGPEWILGLRQTKGRGRRGRVWADPVGNFSATLVMRPVEAPEVIALRSFVAALALHEAFVMATGQAERFALKWPNDVLLDGGKVAGILLETAGYGQGANYLAIGIGVNLAAAPEVGEVEARAFAPVSLAGQTGFDMSPEAFLDLLAASYARCESQFVTYGFGAIREAWLSHAVKLGDIITARTMRDEFTGTFETIDMSGNLVLKTVSGRQAIPAADIFF